MKIILFLHIAALLLLYSCGSLITDDGIKEFIPGTYIRFSQHEYGSEFDTLVISLQNEEASEYRILRKWKYERILDGAAIEPEYKKQTTTGIYNANKKLLRETQTGDILSFDVKNSLLFFSAIQYKKIK